MAAHAPQSAANGSIALGQQRIAVSDQQSIQDMEIEQQVGERRKRRLASAAHVAANTIFHSTVGRGRPLVIVGDGGKTAVGSSGTTPAARIESHFSMSIELMEKWTSQVSFISMQKKKKKNSSSKTKKSFSSLTRNQPRVVMAEVTNSTLYAAKTLRRMWPRRTKKSRQQILDMGDCVCVAAAERRVAFGRWIGTPMPPFQLLDWVFIGCLRRPTIETLCADDRNHFSQENSRFVFLFHLCSSTNPLKPN